MLDLDSLMSNIDYQFKNIELLKQALTHPSTSRSNNYERMEFLGDAILGFVIADILYKKYPFAKESELSSRLSHIVSRNVCSIIGKRLSIPNYINISHGEEKIGGRRLISNIANAVEALIAAIFLDGGILYVQKFIAKYWNDMILSEIYQDPKTILQEWSQSLYAVLPIYEIVNVTGPDHDPYFNVKVTVKDYIFTGSGKSKKTAEIDAAKNMLIANGINIMKK